MSNDPANPPSYPTGYPPVYPPPPSYVAAPHGYPPVARRMNGLAIAAMVLGIVWVYWIGSILAVIFGHVALSQIRKSNGTMGGRGMAIAGVVLGWIGVGTLCLTVIVAIANSGSGGY